MGSTAHFSSLESRAHRRSLESWASFNSFWFCLLSVVWFFIGLIAPTAFYQVVTCLSSVVWLLISLAVPFSFYRHDRDLLELFIIVLGLHDMLYLVLLIAAIYPCIEEGAKVLPTVDAVLKSKDFGPIVAYLFGADVVDTLTDSTRKTIVLMYIGLLTVVFLLALNAIVQTVRLWKEYSKEARELDDWMLENGSYSTTIARSDGTRVAVNIDVKVERSGNTIKKSK